MKNLYILALIVVFGVAIQILLTRDVFNLAEKAATTEHFNGVLFVKNHANTFPLSPDYNIDNQISSDSYMSPYIGWKRIWRQRYAAESPELLQLEQPDFKQDAGTYF